MNKNNLLLMDLSHHSQPSSPFHLFHITLHSSPTSFPVITVAISCILSTAFLLITYYIIVTKCCLNHHHQTDVISSNFNSFQQLEAEKGLEEFIIRSIPIIKFQKVVKPRQQTEPGSFKPDPDTSYECSVCLNEFQDGEKLRVIPICCHAFHIDCIDTWLQTNANCPLCRSGISPGSVLVPNNDLRIFSNGVCKEDDDFVVIEIQGHNVDNPNHQQSDRVNNRKMEKLPSIGDEWVDIRADDDEFRVDQPMRRSISMDLSIDRELLMEIRRSCSDDTTQGEICSSNVSSSKVRKCILSFGYGGSFIKPTLQ